MTVVDTVAPVSAQATLLAYIRLTKPRIIELLLVTTVPVMMLAEQGWPGTWLVIATVAGGSLSAGGANVLNNVCDRDIDALMHRTADRPLVTAEVTPRAATVFGFLLGLGGYVMLATFANHTAALLSTAALVFYVVVYTLLLKRRTPQNIVIGGAAGAVPVLVGWAAVDGGVSVEALLLFAVVFLWTPPHFWALAIRYREDYARASVPMLPSVVGVPATIRQIKMYTVPTVVVSLALALSDRLGPLYLLAAAALGLWFVLESRRLTAASAMRFFGISIVYLTALFAAVAIDAIVG